MRSKNLFGTRLWGALFLMACACGAASAQTQDRQPAAGPRDASTYYLNDVHCAGFIEYGNAYGGLEVVGAEQEATQNSYATGDYLYINGGKQQGLREGQEFSVIRPRTLFKSAFQKKESYLGVYVQEIGKIRITKVMDRVSAAVVEATCEMVLLGDYLRGVPRRERPPQQAFSANLDRFSDPSGKQTGRIVLARGAREMLATYDTAYIDLGEQDGVKPGDTLTIYRKLDKGTVTHFRDDNIVQSTSGGYESSTFKGGKFSLQSPRTQRPERTGIYGGPVASKADVKGRRPPMPRKIVGEMVIVSVQERTATAMITRVTQEVHTGDSVELQ